VVEDYARFVLDDVFLTGQMKQLRHDLSAALARVGRDERLASRETQADVGTASAAEGLPRSGPRDVAAANFSRLGEALRSLEESAKTFDPALAITIEQLRYRAYTLERAVDAVAAGAARLGGVRLYVLLDGGVSLAAFRSLAEAVIGAGAPAVQLRDKALSDRDLVERGHLLRELTRGGKTLFIMNDRPDLAALVGADGVHIGQDDLSVKDARAIVGPRKLVGVSTHSVDQARRAVLDGASYIGIGPAFPSQTKRFHQHVGTEMVAAVVAQVRLPAFAIGGITTANLSQVLEVGCTRVAVSAAVTAAPHPAEAVRTLLRMLDEAAAASGPPPAVQI
jgi:thiamine-phosphate pyrophosphorylase